MVVSYPVFSMILSGEPLSKLQVKEPSKFLHDFLCTNWVSCYITSLELDFFENQVFKKSNHKVENANS